jgi:hypothetical protein
MVHRIKELGRAMRVEGDLKKTPFVPYAGLNHVLPFK